MIKKFSEYSINESINDKVFNHTLYRIPTDEELEGFENHPEYTAEDVLNEFRYIIVGRGILDGKNKNMIIECVSKLIQKYPNDERYKETLKLAKELKSRFIKESNEPENESENEPEIDWDNIAKNWSGLFSKEQVKKLILIHIK